MTEPRFEIRLPPLDGESAETQLAVRVLADALGGEEVSWPSEAVEGWDVLEHLARQIPGATITIALPTGGSVTCCVDRPDVDPDP
jgi:hypothetical protein